MLTHPTEMRKTFDPAGRGYHAVYHEHEINHCPGCGRTHWLIGRVSAECAFCATALPLAEAQEPPPGAGLGRLVDAGYGVRRTGTGALHRSTPPAGRM